MVRRLGLLWNAWITKEVCFVNWEVRYGYLTATCQSRVQSPVFAELASLPIQKLSTSETPRGIPEHCPVMFYFLSKSIVGTHSQCRSRSAALSLTVNMIFISFAFHFNPCLQHPWFPSVLCWGAKGALAGEGEAGTCQQVSQGKSEFQG